MLTFFNHKTAPPAAALPIRVMLCAAITALLAFASGAKAQADFFDIGDYDFDCTLWFAPGDPLPTAPFTGQGSAGVINGTGTNAVYALRFGIEMWITNIYAYDQMDIEFIEPTTGIQLGTAYIDTVGFSTSVEGFMTHPITGLEVYFYFGRSNTDMVSVPSTSDLAIAFGMEADDTLSAAGQTQACEHVFFGGDGADYCRGAASTDILYGDWLGTQNNAYTPIGDDQCDGWGGTDLMFGGPRTDQLRGRTGHDEAYGGAGNDTIDGHEGEDHLYGNDIDPTLGTTGNNTIDGGDDDDRIFGGEQVDNIKGGGGADHVEGGGGQDVIEGEAGCDDLWGDYGPILTALGFAALGNDDVDEIYGGTEDDLIFGGGGDDTLRGEAGDDAIDGGAGEDLIDGGTGSDWLHDGDMTDDDWLFGGDGDDFLFSNDGGADKLRGEADDDTYWWNNNPADSIVDNQGTNTINPAGNNPGGYTGANPTERFVNYAVGVHWNAGRAC